MRVGASHSKLAGLALDTEQQLLYYADHIQGIIAEITTSGSNKRLVFSDSSKQPRAIVVDSIGR